MKAEELNVKEAEKALREKYGRLPTKEIKRLTEAKLISMQGDLMTIIHQVLILVDDRDRAIELMRKAAELNLEIFSGAGFKVAPGKTKEGYTEVVVKVFSKSYDDFQELLRKKYGKNRINKKEDGDGQVG